MALTATVAKKSVSYIQPKMHNITFNLILKEDTVEVLSKDVSIQFAEGDTPSAKVAKVMDEMQQEIDHYKSQKTIFNSPALDTAVTNIQSGLIL
jgi:hypothetical protein